MAGGRSLGGIIHAIPSQEQLDQELKVLELRQQGLSFSEIARHEEVQLPGGRGQAHNVYTRAMRRGFVEPAAAVRDLEASRLDRLQSAAWEKALGGDWEAMRAVVRIMERRAKLLGLDHADGIAERTLQLEAERVRLMAVAFGRALDVLNLTPEARLLATRTFVSELKARTDDAGNVIDEDGAPVHVVTDVPEHPEPTP